VAIKTDVQNRKNRLVRKNTVKSTAFQAVLFFGFDDPGAYFLNLNHGETRRNTMRPFPSKYHLRYKVYILVMFIIAVLGGFLSFIFLAKTELVSKALLVGYFYALTLVLVLIFVQKVVVAKLKIFNTIQQWTLRTFIYMITLSVVYLNGLLFQTIILTPRISFGKILSDKFWSSFVSFLSSPLDLQFSESIFKDEYRGILIPFFAVLILIGLISVIGSYVEMRWQQNKQKQAIDRA
jgi:hypothetical protein